MIAQLCSLDVSTLESSISPYLQKVLDNHSKVFETPKGLPPIHDHDHAIHLIPRSVPPNIRPYIYPYAQRSGNSFKSCRRSQFKQYCENLTRKEKSYWNLKQSKKQELDSYEINQFQSISSSGRTYLLKIRHGRIIILYRNIKNYSSVEDNTF